MKNGICPKCNGREVYRHESSPRSSDRITLREGVIGRDASGVDKYVCTDCGYLEYYLIYPDDFGIIQEKWERVTPNRRM